MMNIPVINVVTAIATALAAGGIMWTISTVNEIPVMQRDVFRLEKRVDDHESRMRLMEGSINRLSESN